MLCLRKSFPVVFGVVVLATGCADAPSPTAPLTVEPEAGLLDAVTDLLRPHSVQVLHRTAPLARDEVVTEVIGRRGGTIRLPEAGLTVRFPWGAVSSPTSITVVAPAGDLVGYHFEPHGIRFRRDVAVVQDLSVTDAGGLLERLTSGGLTGAYFEGDLEPTVTALELLPLRVLQLLGLGVFEIEHFSGYVIATN